MFVEGQEGQREEEVAGVSQAEGRKGLGKCPKAGKNPHCDLI
jgi:hypothetical protein